LVAIVVLAIGVVGVMSLLSTGYLSMAMSRQLSVATQLAQQKLEEIKATPCETVVVLSRRPIDPARFPGYDWELNVVRLDTHLVEVQSRVHWIARGRPQHVSLTTLLRAKP
jgi:hypothetical protein